MLLNEVTDSAASLSYSEEEFELYPPLPHFLLSFTLKLCPLGFLPLGWLLLSLRSFYVTKRWTGLGSSPWQASLLDMLFGVD